MTINLNAFDELCTRVSSDIDNRNLRKRSRTESEQKRFEYAVKFLLIDLWKTYHTHPEAECSINKRSGYYSENDRYRDPNLTYKMTIKQAFQGLIDLDLIRITKDGYYDRNKMQGNLTRYKSTHRLTELLQNIKGHPAVLLKPNLDSQTIILRNKINGRRFLEGYNDNKDTEIWRNNLRKINSCFSRHIIDIYLNDEEFANLQDELLLDNDNEPIDLTQKLLVRIFTNKSFESGGRFYRGWWQNVPKDYRQYITIDGKNTREFDFSQLNPNMVYDRYNYELGSEDAYDRVLDGQHRDVVKQAFNAMLQAEKPLNHKPNEINLDEVGLSWKEMKEAIIENHKPIQDLFFKGIGNRLQFEDSCIAENVMLQFTSYNAPALPIHDSFIMHHGYSAYDELEEAMRRAYHDRFKSGFKDNKELVKEVIHESKAIGKPKINDPNNIEWDNIEFDHLMEKRQEYSKWNDRNDEWMMGSKT